MFADIDEEGTMTTTTDASGVDGVGGYAFVADEPGHVWIVSERWPADIQDALNRGAATPAERAAEAREAALEPDDLPR
eukprot:2674301-Pleurochrysis_carterae.AAC.1